MASFVAKDCTIWVGQYDLTADTNEITVTSSFEAKECTTFGSAGNKERRAGIVSTAVELKTFLNTAAGQSEAVTRSINGSTGNILTVTPDGTAGARASFGRALEGDVSQVSKVGEMALLDGSFMSSHPAGFVEGTLILPKTSASGTGSTNGTAYQVGAVASTQTVYAALHVFSASGTLPTLDVKIQSDTVGFPSATDVFSFTQATAATSEWKSLAGANTDDYWRVRYTLGGTTPAFSFAVVLGIF